MNVLRYTSWGHPIRVHPAHLTQLFCFYVCGFFSVAGFLRLLAASSLVRVSGPSHVDHDIFLFHVCVCSVPLCVCVDICVCVVACMCVGRAEMMLRIILCFSSTSSTEAVSLNQTQSSTVWLVSLASLLLGFLISGFRGWSYRQTATPT